MLVCLVLPATAAAGAPLRGIRTPSGNIECLPLPGPAPVLHCTVAASSYAARLQSRCLRVASVDWHGFELGRSTAARVTCSGGILHSPGTQRPVYRTLAYGATWRRGGFTCSSARTGLTCRTAAGHGLFLARESWRAW